VLRDAQQRGAIGPGSLGDTIEHARGFFHHERPPVGAVCADLGSGGGVPGLVLAVLYPDTRWVLIDAREARADRLRIAVQRLGVGDRVDVVGQPAEDVGRSPARGTFDVVTARGFGTPAVTAECAAPLLRVDGRLIVSTTSDEKRWDDAVLDELGLGRVTEWATRLGSYRMLRQARLCPAQYPRRPGTPRRRPLF
jgi:16S rRNA (guanine527-N7)-methyltransferase